MGKAVAYSRVSSNEQVLNNSLNHQRRSAEEVASRHGHSLVRYFSDEGISAKDVKRRPQLLLALAYVRENLGPGDVFIILDASRMARNLGDAAVIFDELRRCGVCIVTPNKVYEHDAESRLMWQLESMMADFDNEKKSEQSRERMARRVSDGRWLWRTSLGYVTGNEARPKDERSMVIQAAEAELVVRAFNAVARGESVHSVALSLMSERAWKERFPKHKVASAGKRLRTILADEKYVGRFRCKQTNGEIVKGDWEPIVSIELFDLVQARLGTRTYSPKDTEVDNFVLRRLLNCSICGRKYTSMKAKGGRYPYYICGNASHKREGIPMAEALRQVEVILAQYVIPEPLQASVIASIRDEVAAELQEVLLQKAALSKELRETNERIDRYVEHIVSGTGLSESRLTSMMHRSEERVAELQGRIDQLEVRDETYLNTCMRIAIELLSNPLETWKALSPKEQQAFGAAVFGPDELQVVGRSIQTSNTLKFPSQFANSNPDGDTWYAQRDLNPCCRRERAVS